MSRTHAPSGWAYRTQDPEELHEKLWEGFEGETAWDIGANEGQSVDRMVRSFRRVIALEPAIESFRILEREWGRWPGVTVLNMAAGETSGRLTMSVRMTPIAGGQLVSPDMPQAGWHGAEVYQRSVPCTTLDVMMLDYGVPSLVKIDTEGFEEQILRGGRDLIRIGCDWLIEYHSRDLMRECLNLLGDGYDTEVVPNGEAGSGNGWLLVKAVR